MWTQITVNISAWIITKMNEVSWSYDCGLWWWDSGDCKGYRRTCWDTGWWHASLLQCAQHYAAEYFCVDTVSVSLRSVCVGVRVDQSLEFETNCVAGWMGGWVGVNSNHLCRNKQRKFDTGSSSLLTPHIISI